MSLLTKRTKFCWATSMGDDGELGRAVLPALKWQPGLVIGTFADCKGEKERAI